MRRWVETWLARLTERIRELIPQTGWCISEWTICAACFLMTRRHFPCHQLSLAGIVSVYVCDSILNSHQISTSWYWFCHQLSRTTIIFTQAEAIVIWEAVQIDSATYCMLSIVRAFSSHRLVLCWQYFPHAAIARARLRYRRRVRLSHDRSESKLMNRASGFRIIFFPFFTRRSAALTLNVTLNLFLAEHLHSCHRHYYDGVIVVTQKCGVLKVSSSNLYLKCDKRTWNFESPKFRVVIPRWARPAFSVGVMIM